MNKTIEMKAYSEEVFEQLKQTKTVKDISVNEDDIKKVLEVVDQVNALTLYDRRIDGLTLDEVFLPSWTEPFIFPQRVYLEPNFEAPDLVVRPDKNDSFEYDEAEIRRIENGIAGAFRQTAKSLVTAKAMREKKGDVALASVKKALVFDGSELSCHKDGDDLFVPVPVDGYLRIAFSKFYFNTSVDDVMEHFFLRSFSFGYARAKDSKF